jgi:hypothetical protein
LPLKWPPRLPAAAAAASADGFTHAERQPDGWVASFRNSLYTSGKSCSAACGSPCSMADRMRVTPVVNVEA